MAMRILNFIGAPEPAPSAAWAKAVSKTVGFIFGFDGTQPVPDIRPKPSTTDTNFDSEASADPAVSWKVYTDRKRMCQDIHNMDTSDEIVSKALDIIAEEATCYDAKMNYRQGEKPGSVKPTDKGYEFGYRVISGNDEVQKILNGVTRRLELDKEIWQIVRRMVKYGVYLPEILLDESRSFVMALNETSSHEIWPMTNSHGHKVPGWVYKQDKDVYSATTGNAGSGVVTPGVKMEEWQICPFIFGPKVGFFTQPMLAPARYNWKRLQRLEDNMAVQRLKSTDRYVHQVPVGANMNAQEVKQTLLNYKQSMTKRTQVSGNTLNSGSNIVENDSPYDGYTEFFIAKTENNPGDIKILNPSGSHLGNLTDIYYHRERLLTRLGVPISYLQINSAQKTHLTAKSGMGGVEKQFLKFLRRVQEALRAGLHRLYDTQLMLSGIVPTEGLYFIELPFIALNDNLDDAKAMLANAQAAVYFTEAFGALPLNLLSEMFLGLTTEQQSIMSKFIDTYGTKIVNAKIAALSMAAKPPQVGGAKQRVTGVKPGGNSGKSKGQVSTEQKGGSVQGAVYLEDAVDLFMTMKTQIESALLANGVTPDQFSDLSADEVREDLARFIIPSEDED